MLKIIFTRQFFLTLIFATPMISCFCSQEALSERQNAPIHDAVIEDDAEHLRTLVEENKNVVHQLNKQGLTPLHLAAKLGRKPAIIEILIQAGARVDARAPSRITPLHLAADEGNSHIAQLLLQNQADTNAQNFDRRTPLHMACFKGNLELITALVQHRATISAPDIFGLTPLDIAASRMHPHVVQFLIRSLPETEQQGAKEKSKNRFSAIWEKIALEESILLSGKKEVENDPRFIYDSIEEGDVTSVKAILDNHPVVLTFCMLDQGSPLHFACSLGKLEIVKLLVARGADVTGRTLKQKTPLDSAASAGHTYIVQFLLDIMPTANQEWIKNKIKKKFPALWKTIQEEEKEEESIYG